VHDHASEHGIDSDVVSSRLSRRRSTGCRLTDDHRDAASAPIEHGDRTLWSNALVGLLPKP
jgi:hypothetical protein